MPELDDTEPIADDELLYRRVPVAKQHYHRGRELPLDAEAFLPRKSGSAPDTTGISLVRAKFYNSPQETGKSQKGFYVAVLRAGDLREAGIDMEILPDPMQPGHVQLPQLRTAKQKSVECRNLMKRLAEKLCLRVEGPFFPVE